MDMNASLDLIVQAIKRITNPRFYGSERGFQGQLKSNIDSLLKENNLFSDHAIVEEEYQKTLPKHGITHRPDIIIHIPIEEGVTRSRNEGNFVAFELTLQANRTNAINAFRKLNDYVRILHYQLGIYVNINSETSFVELVPDDLIHVLNVLRDEQRVVVTHSHLENGKPVSHEL
jgi:hypothetical protein